MDIQKLYDVVIIGGGPAGLTAALYLARSRCRVLVAEKEQFGGQIAITSEIVNYPGVGLVGGSELSDSMRRQAESFGGEFLLCEVTGMNLDSDVKVVHTSKGDVFCFGVIAAMGAYPRMIGFKGEKEFRGHGVAYCATCDGEFFTGKEVFVVGGGFAAAEESVYLTRYARHVTILVREEDFTCARSVAEQAKEHPGITVLYETEVESVSGDTDLRTIRYRSNRTGKVTEYKAEAGDTFGVFVFAGYVPETDLIRDIVRLNEWGYVITDKYCRTNIDGLYAAGDICEKNLRQVVTAVSDGAIAASELEKYVSHKREKTGLIPILPKTSKEKPALQSTASDKGDSSIFSSELKGQLDTVFAKMESSLSLRLYLDSSKESRELEAFIRAMAELTDKLSVVTDSESGGEEHIPFVRIFREDGSSTGLAFHGVPDGHEFTSFVLGLYNSAGPGQPMDERDRAAIARISKPMDIQVLVTKSCTMCPELVTAVQRIAAENSLVTAEIYDIGYFTDLREKHHVMSVPCLLVDGKVVSFGKKNLTQVLELLV